MTAPTRAAVRLVADRAPEGAGSLDVVVCLDPRPMRPRHPAGVAR
jgi:hypothetical protein